MRLLDVKGVASLAIGGALSFLLQTFALGANMQRRLGRINELLTEYYDARPRSNRIPPIRQSNLKSDGWWDLHGPCFKAANVRCAVPAFLQICRRFLVSESAEETTAIKILESLVAMYDVFYQEPMFVPGAACRRLSAATLAFGLEFQRARQQARRREVLAYNITPKVHKTQHLPLMASALNPSFVQNYDEESQMGTTGRVWKKSMSGRFQKHVQKLVLVKRTTALPVRLEL